MSNISDEVSREARGVATWRRIILIVAANALGTLIGGGLLGFCAIVWSKANSTDGLRVEIRQNAELTTVAQGELLREVAKLRAEHEKERETPVGVMLPHIAPPPASAREVDAAQEDLQQKVDKAIYRQQQSIAR